MRRGATPCWVRWIKDGSYLDWMRLSGQPNLTTLLTYGDDTDSSTAMDYRKMRFGLTTALLDDGFFSFSTNQHLLGKSPLPWFDEYDGGGIGKGYLGMPEGPPRTVEPTPSGPNLTGDAGGGTASELMAWDLYGDANTVASKAIDGDAPAGRTGSLRIDVTKAPGEDWRCALISDPVSVRAGSDYTLTFWAKADKPRDITAWVQRDTSPWNRWLDSGPIELTTSWQRIEIPWTSTGTDPAGRFEIGVGASTGSVWLDGVTLVAGSRQVLRRDFTGGASFVNPSDQTRTVDPGPGLRFIAGAEVPEVNTGLPASSVTIPPHDGVILVTDTAPGPTLESMAGLTRYETAMEVSRAGFGDGSCQAVVLATGDNYPDALCAAGLAGAVKAPILLAHGQQPDPALLAEIDRLTHGRTGIRLYIVGGTGVVSSSFESALKSRYGSEAVRRLGGMTRYDTASLAAEELTAVLARQGRAASGRAIVVSGREYADALLAGPAAYGLATPILLAGPTVTAASWSDSLAAADATSVTILGSTANVPVSTEETLDSVLGTKNVTRPCSATDTYQMAADVAQWTADLPGFGWDGVGLATGATFPDGLAASALQGSAHAPLLLTKPDVLPSPVQAKLAANRGTISTVHVFGGTGAISPVVRTAVRAAVTP